MKLLIIGGTRFLGRHLVTSALARNHNVTLFNRGNHALETAAVETIEGDRHTDLHKLKGRRWDAVVDTCGHLPRAVRAAAEVLSNSVNRYVFISSQNAYANVSVPNITEDYPLGTLTSEQLDQANAIGTEGQPSYGALYGGLKALCEEAAQQMMPGRVLILRPGLIVGPYDYSDRFTYWVVRVAGGGEVLAPGRPGRFIQFIDARDLAEWTIRMIEREAAGAYNVHGRPNALTMQGLLEECKLASNSDARFVWASEEFLLREGVAAWSEMPLWLPEEAAPHLKGFMFIDPSKAIADGLQFRPLRETISDTLAWYQASDVNEPLKAGFKSDKERSLLDKVHSHQDS
ncbi:MAG TPA: NAD-dependent epimerase/dehydratase family protein [Pyrinomonadaceae bacterium]|jgi:2'-hydroxyisoflavone reductase|nr:NAD-dependent epimerase/dehydratase family protein [Pyrinomonadaceae bacterium]